MNQIFAKINGIIFRKGDNFQLTVDSEGGHEMVKLRAVDFPEIQEKYSIDGFWEVMLDWKLGKNPPFPQDWAERGSSWQTLWDWYIGTQFDRWLLIRLAKKVGL